MPHPFLETREMRSPGKGTHSLGQLALPGPPPLQRVCVCVGGEVWGDDLARYN